MILYAGFTTEDLLRFRYLLDCLGYTKVKDFVEDVIDNKLVSVKEQCIRYHEKKLKELKNNG